MFSRTIESIDSDRSRSIILDGAYMICDNRHVIETGMTKTIYSDFTIEILEFLPAEEIKFKRRVDITYTSQTAVQNLLQSSHVCQESFDLSCSQDYYVDFFDNYKVACRCTRFVRQTEHSYLPGYNTSER